MNNPNQDQQDWETECPSEAANVNQYGRRIHCECWYQGSQCCYCDDPPTSSFLDAYPTFFPHD